MALTIRVVTRPTRRSNCGGAYSRVQWVISDRKSGYVIQHVKDTNAITDCAGNKKDEKLGRGKPVPEFWEAWKVTNGQVFIGNTTHRHRYDTFAVDDQGRPTEGKVEIDGTVKFIEGYALGAEWKMNDVPEAGSLPTSRSTPNRWTEAGTLVHTLTSTWNCCADPPATPTVVTGEPMPKPKRGETLSPKVRKALGVLSDMPAWSELRADDTKGRRSIEKAVRALEKMDLETVRAAVDEYMDYIETEAEGLDIPLLSRIFVLNRYLFDLPERAPLGSVKLFGGWGGVSIDEETLDPLFPWEKQKGRKRLTGTYAGYRGDLYLGLEEFDYMHREFPPETSPRSKGKGSNGKKR